MNIQGLQKLTLLDYPEKVACTIFTAGCNFRCPFCHNAALVTSVNEENNIREEEVLSFLDKRKSILDGVCITGGEPLLQGDIETFIKKVKLLGYAVKLDTNGSDSKRLRSLVHKGLLDYVAMDIKNTPDKYGLTIGVEGYQIDEILESADFLLSGTLPYEFRTTVVREYHKREDFVAIGHWLKGAKEYYLQTFVDSGDLIQTGLSDYTKHVMEEALEILRENIPNAKLRGAD